MEKQQDEVEKIEQTAIAVDTGKELDIEAIEDLVRNKVRKEIEDENALTAEAERVSYLKTLDLDTIEDETSRKIIEEVLSSKLKRKDKVESIQKLAGQSAILSCLNKAENMEPGQINSYALKTLKTLKNLGKNLTPMQIVQAESAIGSIDVDFQRIGKENLSQGLDIQVDEQSLTPTQKLSHMMKNYQNKELEKRGKSRT